MILGGHVELGETMVEALKREIKEEVGLDIEVDDMIEVQDAIYDPQYAKRKHFIFHDFVARCKSDKVRMDNIEITEFIWVDPKEALRMHLASFTRKSIEAYFKRRKA